MEGAVASQGNRLIPALKLEKTTTTFQGLSKVNSYVSHLLSWINIFGMAHWQTWSLLGTALKNVN